MWETGTAARRAQFRTVRLAKLRSWNGGRENAIFLLLPVLKYCEVSFDVQSANLRTGKLTGGGMG
jgi:hypothetical protein